MKIKRKVQKNLPQLIEWGFENDVTNTWYRASNVEEYISEVFFNATGLPQFSSMVDREDTFTVEVEEEITEDTKFSHIVFIDDCDLSASYENKSINEIKYGHDKEFHAYIDGEFKLIWTQDKGLVE